MTITLNHTIVPARDKAASARWLDMLNAAPDKTKEAAAELRAKGIPVQRPMTEG